MTDLTTGKRIAQCRRQLNLSQEALGEKVGVSRQAISKWEADAALPDIDKLIALSRLFQVSVGWLLGVEEQPQPQPESPQLDEELLRKIEEVVRRYQPRKKPLTTGKKVLIGIAAVLLLWAGMSLSRQWQKTRLEVTYLGAQLRNNNEQNSSILRQLDTLEERIENINITMEEAAASLASYAFEIIPNVAEAWARVELTAIPKNWNEDWTATLHVRHQGALSVTQECHWDGTALNAALKLNFVDDLEYYLVISYPDGTQESMKLQDEEAQNLRRSCTILYAGTPVLAGYQYFAHQKTIDLHFKVEGMHLQRPHPEENPGDWFWTRADYVLYRTRDGVRTEAGICPILSVEEDAKTYELWGSTLGFTIEEPREGDTYELWVMLELQNGLSLEECTGTWIFQGNSFLGME